MNKKMIVITICICAIFISACSRSDPALTSDQIQGERQSYESITSTVSPLTTTIPKTVVVPNMIGRNKNDITKELDGLGLKYNLKNIRVQYRNDIYEKEYMLPDGEITYQSINAGTIVAVNTEIEIWYAMQESDFRYLKNADNTITIIGFQTLINDEGIVTIPKTYDGLNVSAIDLTSFLEIISSNYTYKLKVPNNVIVNNNNKSKTIEIIRY